MPIWNISLPSIFMGRMRRDDHGLGDVMAARAGNFDFLAPLQAHALSQLIWDFDETAPARVVTFMGLFLVQ